MLEPHVPRHLQNHLRFQLQLQERLYGTNWPAEPTGRLAALASVRLQCQEVEDLDETLDQVRQDRAVEVGSETLPPP